MRKCAMIYPSYAIKMNESNSVVQLFGIDNLPKPAMQRLTLEAKKQWYDPTKYATNEERRNALFNLANPELKKVIRNNAITRARAWSGTATWPMDTNITIKDEYLVYEPSRVQKMQADFKAWKLTPLQKYVYDRRMRTGQPITGWSSKSTTSKLSFDPRVLAQWASFFKNLATPVMANNVQKATPVSSNVQPQPTSATNAFIEQLTNPYFTIK